MREMEDWKSWLPSSEGWAKAGFVLSLVVLALLYGWASRTQGWFPDGWLERAWLQGEREVTQRRSPPDFTSGRAYRRSGVTVAEPGAMQPGLTLITSTWEDFGWQPGARLVDRQGNVLHEWSLRPTELFADSLYRRQDNELSEQDIHGTYLFPSGDLLVNVEYAGTVRLDACSGPKWRLQAGNHHSIARADDGTFWTPGVSGLRPARSQAYPDGYPGVQGPHYQDYIVHFDADGEVLNAINVLDVLYDNGLERLFPKFDAQQREDPTHLNDVEPLSTSMADEYPTFGAGDLLLSMPPIDLVAVLDPESGEVKWHTTHPIMAQHDPDWMGDGWVGIFDNNVDNTRRGTMLGGSRIVAVEPATDSTRVLFPTEESDPFYTGIRGKWQELDNGNLLLTESAVGRVVEVAPDGRTLWEWVAEPYNRALVPNVTKATRVDVTREEVSSWPCPPQGTSQP